MMDGGNLVAEEDVMTKLPAIKTRFHFEGLLSSAEMYSESQILRFIMEQVGEIICDLMIRSFAICHKLSQLYLGSVGTPQLFSKSRNSPVICPHCLSN